MWRKLGVGTSAAFLVVGIGAGPALAHRLANPGESCVSVPATGPERPGGSGAPALPTRPSAGGEICTESAPPTSPAAPPVTPSAPESPPPGGSESPPSSSGTPCVPGSTTPGDEQCGPSGGPESPGGPGGGPPGPGGRVPTADTSNNENPPLAQPPAPEAPAPAPAPEAQTAPKESIRQPAGNPAELPRTGHDSRPLVAIGGANLLAAGLALIGAARRRRPSPQP